MTGHACHSMKWEMAANTHTHNPGRACRQPRLRRDAAGGLFAVDGDAAELGLHRLQGLRRPSSRAAAPTPSSTVGIIVSILIVAWLISRLNRLYIGITGTNRLAPMRPSWMRSMRDTGPPPRNTTVVEAVLMGSVLLRPWPSPLVLLLAGSPLPNQ